jgi:hypothetical protein
MTRRRIFIMLGVIVLALAIGAALTFPPRPSTSEVRDAKQFCESIDSITSQAEVLSRAKAFKRRAIIVETRPGSEAGFLVRTGLCHCWVSFSATGTSTSGVICNG